MLIEFSFFVLESPVFLYCFTFCLYVFNLHSLPGLSGLFPQVVLLFFIVLPVPFCFRLFQCLYFFYYSGLFWKVFFLFAFPVEFPIPVVIIIYSLIGFPISLSWWSFTDVWVTASLLKSPALFSVFFAVHYYGQMLGCAYTICSYGQIWITCTLLLLSSLLLLLSNFLFWVNITTLLG